MALTLQEYASFLDKRTDLLWPAPPEIERPKAKPYLARFKEIRAVTWSVYGTLLSIAGGELYLEHPVKFNMEVALDKTIQEFKMWSSMVRKPGQPADYLAQIYKNLLVDQQTLTSGSEKYPEVQAHRLWESFIKKLLQKDYVIDANIYGSLNEFSLKVAYFFHASLQGTACYPGAAAALRQVSAAGLVQGLIADGQCFTSMQLERGLLKQDPAAKLDDLVDPKLRGFSYEVRGKKPSDRIFRHVAKLLAQQDISPGQVLHIGSRVTHDVLPARRLGMKTGLFAGDKTSLQATAEQMSQPASRPDVLLTELTQIADVVA